MHLDLNLHSGIAGPQTEENLASVLKEFGLVEAPYIVAYNHMGWIYPIFAVSTSVPNYSKWRAAAQRRGYMFLTVS